MSDSSTTVNAALDAASDMWYHRWYDASVVACSAPRRFQHPTYPSWEALRNQYGNGNEGRPPMMIAEKRLGARQRLVEFRSMTYCIVPGCRVQTTIGLAVELPPLSSSRVTPLGGWMLLPICGNHAHVRVIPLGHDNQHEDEDVLLLLGRPLLYELREEQRADHAKTTKAKTNSAKTTDDASDDGTDGVSDDAPSGYSTADLQRVLGRASDSMYVLTDAGMAALPDATGLALRGYFPFSQLRHGQFGLLQTAMLRLPDLRTTPRWSATPVGYPFFFAAEPPASELADSQARDYHASYYPYTEGLQRLYLTLCAGVGCSDTARVTSLRALGHSYCPACRVGGWERWREINRLATPTVGFTAG